MKTIRSILATMALGTLCGCVSPDPDQADREYSDMPWNTPQQWEGSRQIPGLSPGY